MSAQDLLGFALHLADLADAIALEHFRNRPAQRRKPDGTIVTVADETIERTIRTEIAASYPGHAIVGEEEGTTGSGGTRWIVDPIDGTQNFSWGIPVWGTLIALERDGEIVAGVASLPAMRERYDAARGAGARRNGAPIAVSAVDELSDARVGHGHLDAWGFDGRLERVVDAAASARGFADLWGHLLVASGSLDAMLDPVVSIWDLAPMPVILEEAGGRFTDFDGRRRIDGGTGASSNGLIHDQLLGRLR